MPQLIQAVGIWYFIALAAVVLAAAAKHASAARSPEEDHARSLVDRLNWLVSLLGWALLVLHGAVAAAASAAPIWLPIALPPAAMLLGAIAGGLAGAGAQALAPALRKMGPWLGAVTLALSLVAAWPSIAILLGVSRA
ncbi:MAG: hypothetical protein ACREH4_12360 [Vitreimonas sp.]